MKKNDPQEVYARWLERGARFTFGFALVSLLAYLAGLLTPLVPMEDLPRLWTLSADDLRREANAPGGWEWLRLVRYGDYLNLLGISLFALLSLVCTARVIPAFLASGERVQALLAAIQVLVLLVASLNLFPGAP